MPAATTELPESYKTKSGKVLTPKETKFVNMMVITRWDRLASALEAFDIDKEKPGWYFTAHIIAFEYLKKPKITEALKELYTDQGITPELADRELQFVMEQRSSLPPKVSAIHEYNAITGRHIAPDQNVLVETLEQRLKRKKLENG